MTRSLPLALTALALLAAPAFAQQPAAEGHGDMMTHMICEMGVLPHPGMHALSHDRPAEGAQPAPAAPMQGMMRGDMDHSLTAFMLWEHGDEMGLALTATQKTQFQELATKARTGCEQHIAAAAKAHMAANSALANGDIDEYEDQLEDALEHAVAAHVPVIRSGLEAKALLTESQRAKLSAPAAHRNH